MRQLLTYSILLLLSFYAKAQSDSDSIRLIKDVNIVSNRLPNFVAGKRIENIDSISKKVFKNENLADILEYTSGISIKTYGVSGIASASIRGTNSNHIAVLWNGFNIQDPLTSGLGLSLIPNSFVDDISVQYGGSSSLFGSGAIGGVIHLNNKADFNKGFKTELNSSYGSFNRYYLGLNLAFSNKNINSRIKTFYKSEENDFPFINTSKFGSPEEINRNSAVENKGLLQENFIRFSDYSLLSTHYWYQDAFREVPNNMTTNAGNAYQEDLGHKAAIKYYKNIDKFDIYFKSGGFYNWVHYVNNDVDINAIHSSYQWITELESKLSIDNYQILNLGINNHYTQGESVSFVDNKQLNTLAFYLSYKYKSKSDKIVIVGSVREEYYNNKFIEPNFSLGGNFIFSKKIEGKTNLSKDFRVPTFNDLYWADGFAKGNPDLVPEKAYTSEFGVVYSPLKEKHLFNIELTLFANYIKDLILWQPVNNIWQPVNLKENFARGLELNLKGQAAISSFILNYKLSYSYTKSTVEKVAENESENTLHKQLPYVPYQSLNINLTMALKGFSVSYFQDFTGIRYTDATNSRQLDAYLIGNLFVNYKFQVSDLELNTYLKINNIWNTTYQMVYLYPNPLRNFQIGLNIVIGR